MNTKKLSNKAENPALNKGAVGNCTFNKPHCWGKMNWILKYEDGKEPRNSICNCEHGSNKCKALTRQNAQ